MKNLGHARLETSSKTSVLSWPVSGEGTCGKIAQENCATVGLPGIMDLYERLARVLMRRKYARVEGRNGPLTKSSSLKIPRDSRWEKKFVASEEPSSSSSPSSTATTTATTSTSDLPVVLPKRRTLRSSSNDVIDEVWFNQALRRSVAEGRLKLESV